MKNIWVSVQVLPLALDGPANSLWQSAPIATRTITQSFLLDIAPTATVSELFHCIDKRYKDDYLPTAQHNSFLIKKLQDEDGDDLAINFCVGDLPRNAKDKLVIKVIPAVMNRELSLPVASSLRPFDFARPSKRPAGFSDDAPNKRLRHEDVDYDAPASTYHPDQPIRSTERTFADYASTSLDQSSPPPRQRPQGSYGDIVVDSEDERRNARSEDEHGEEENDERETNGQNQLQAKSHLSPRRHTSARSFAKASQPVRDGSSPEHNGTFKKPALPRSAVRESASTPVRNLPASASRTHPVSNQTLEDQWRHARPRSSQPEQNDDPFEILDTDNERGGEPSAGHALGSIVSRQQSLQQLKKRRRSRGETSDLEQSPRPRSGDPERRNTKTYGSARSKKLSSATRLAFADSQSQPTPQEHRPFTPDLNGFEEMLAEPMPSREELARRRSKDERNDNEANAEITRQYFQTASAEKARNLATLSGNNATDGHHIRQPSLSTRPTTTPSDVAGDASPTPASRPLPNKDLPPRRTSSVSFAIPDDATTSSQAAASRTSSKEPGSRRNLHSHMQPPTVAGPSSEASAQKRNTPFSTPAARMRQTVVGNLGKSHTPSTESSKRSEQQGSGKKAPACARCKTLKMACSATKLGLYPCAKCVKASLSSCAPPTGSTTPMPSRLKHSVSASSKSKGKAPERAPRAGTLESMRISQDPYTEVIDDSDNEDEQTPIAQRGPGATGQERALSLQQSAKQQKAGTILKPLAKPSVNGHSKKMISTENGVPPALAEAFRTPSASVSPQLTEEVADTEPISQEDESPGSEGDIESNVSDEAGSSKNQTQGQDQQIDNNSSVSSKRNGTGEVDSDDDDSGSSSDSSEDEEEDIPSSKVATKQQSAGAAKTPTPPQSFQIPSSHPSNLKSGPQSTRSPQFPVNKSNKKVLAEEKSTSPPVKLPTSSADGLTRLPSRRRSDDSDSDSSSSSSSSSAGSASSADDITKMSRKLDAVRARHAGQSAVASSAAAQASAKASKFGNVKNFISSTFGFSSSQHDNGGRDAWYNVPDSPEPGL